MEGAPEGAPAVGAAAALEHAGPKGVEVLERLRADAALEGFLADAFDAAQHTSAVLERSSAAASAHTLNEGIHSLEQVLRSEVLARHDELLAQVGSLKDMESLLATVRSGVGGLQATVARVKAEIAEPYRAAATRTRQLAALSQTVDLLQRVIRLLKLAQRLRDVLAAPTPDLPKAAKTLTDIEAVRAEGDLTGVKCVADDVAYLSAAGKTVRAKAGDQLRAGMATLSQAEVGSALQVYFNLSELPETVDALLHERTVEASRVIADALDATKLTVDRSGAGGKQRLQEALWQRLEAGTQKLHATAMSVWHLQRVLAKKRDPITHVLFLDEVAPSADTLPCVRFWHALCRTLADQLAKAVGAAGFVKETLTAGYPQLMAVLEAFITNLGRESDQKGVPPAVRLSEGTGDARKLFKATELFQNAYLARSLTRLSDAAGNVFAGSRSGAPTAGEVGKYVTRIREELEATAAHPSLAVLVLAGVGKSARLFAEKCEYALATGPETRQVSGPATPAQQRNFAICSAIEEVMGALAAILPKLPPEAGETLGKAVSALDGLASETLQPLFKALVEQAEAAVLKMHDDKNLGADHGIDIGAGITGCSPYMDDLIKLLAHAHAEYLSRLPAAAPRSAARMPSQALMHKAASRLLIFFVRHAALVRPLSESGRLQLAKDMAELELAVGQHLHAVDALGAPYRALRAFRPLLFLEVSQLSQSPLLSELPPSVVLHHAYTRAPAELQSPYTRASLTPAQYSAWLDRHGEADVWQGVKGTLDAYAQSLKSAKGAALADAYHEMLRVGANVPSD